jgi:hypothetical protein
MDDFRLHLVRSDNAPPYFEPLIVGRFRLSVQAGSFVYSHPQADIADVQQYSHWEVAILRGDEWIQADDPVLSELAIAPRFGSPGGTCVAPYTPTDEVQACWVRLWERESQ